MKWKNELTTALKISFPVVQAPMLGVTTPEMVATISNEGGLGSLPVGGLSPDVTKDLIQKTKAQTGKPFAVNLFAHSISAINIPEVEEMKAFLEVFCIANSIPYKKPDINAGKFYTYADQVDILLSENIPIVSFTFGVLNDESIKALKNKGVILIGTATCIKEAILLEQKGIDIITAQGIEAGGHRGTFLEDEPLPMIGTFSLVPQMVDRVSTPVLAAGGINNGKTIKAAFALGASGVQIGTVFIAGRESMAIPSYKSAIRHAADTDSVLTKSISGRWARGLRNKFITEVENAGLKIPGYPLQQALTAQIKAFSQQQNNKEFMPLWAGQSSSNTEEKPAAVIFKELIRQTEEAG